MSEKVIAVFDIGKTNKKILLFDEQLNVAYQHEEKFKTTIDSDGEECDDLDLIENWILITLSDLITGGEYNVTSVNFSTYGASLAFIDEDGKRLTPIYNYLKEVPSEIQESLFSKYGGKTEFCRKTASPALGLLLNSGIQIQWMKQKHPDVFKKATAILHFPQYLSYLLTKTIVSESTSIGCHTFMWDFDKNTYHQWLKDEGISLPEPMPNKHSIPIKIEGHTLRAGIGIHDSSASLAPYIRGSKENFLLVSTGTWCINMNPFNHSPLTKHQLENDCLSYLSIDQKPVKSSRLFMGHIHDVNTKLLTDFFKVPEDSFKKVKTDEAMLSKFISEGKIKVFFMGGMPENYIDNSVDLNTFTDFSEAYHRLIYDLTLLTSESINLISEENDGVKAFYVSGGFARNEIFVRLLANFYSDKKVYTSEVDNSSALGAALVVWEAMSQTNNPEINLGLKEWTPFCINVL